MLGKDQASTWALVRKAVIILWALYVISAVLSETAKPPGQPSSRNGPPSITRNGNDGPSQNNFNSQGNFRGQGPGSKFTHKEETCTAGEQNPISAPDEHCDVTSAFTYETLTFTGESTGNSIDTFVVLPQGYDRNRAKPYKVVFSLHPAEKKSETSMQSFFKLMKWRLDASMCSFMQVPSNDYILVYPSGGDRCYVNSMDGVTSMAEDNVVKDVVPYVLKNYNAATENNVCFGMSMGAYGCILFGLKYPQIFPNVVVQSPGRYPRFVEWEELISNEGPKQTSFSSRDFLLKYVFDEASYDSYDLCTVANSLQAGAAAKSNFVIFHGDKDPYAEQVDDIIGCLQDNHVPLKAFLVNGCGHGDLPMCMVSKPQHTCFIQLMDAAISS